MKMVISFNGLKRRIEGEFCVCISTKDLDDLIKKLSDASSAMKGRGIESGWIDIRDPLLKDKESHALDWHDRLNADELNQNR